MSLPHRYIEDHYSSEEGKRDFVSELFNKGAPHYDRIGKIGFFGTGHFYRKRSVVQAGLVPGMKVLDVACGTGAVTRAIVEVLNGDGEVYGVDPSVGMRSEAEKSIEGATFVRGDAEHLPFDGEQFDFLSMGYALRHVDDLGATFAEYFRVLKPGGRMLILEITRPRTALGMFWSKLYFRDMLPTISYLITGDSNAKRMMSYYWETIDACVPPDAIMSAIDGAGFSGVSRAVSLGIFSLYIASKDSVG